MNRVWRCSAAARWLPRVVGGSVIAAGVIAAHGLGPDPATTFTLRVRAAVVLAAAAVALWLVRKSGETRIEIALATEGLVFRAGRREAVLGYREIESLRFEPPFSASRSDWLPALALTDREGRSWRVPAVIGDGAGFVGALVEGCGRSDLAAWAEALALDRRMSHAGRRVALGYAIALGVVGAAALAFGV